MGRLKLVLSGGRGGASVGSASMFKKERERPSGQHIPVTAMLEGQTGGSQGLAGLPVYLKERVPCPLKDPMSKE